MPSSFSFAQSDSESVAFSLGGAQGKVSARGSATFTYQFIHSRYGSCPSVITSKQVTPNLKVINEHTINAWLANAFESMNGRGC